jgi:hypothetical protein
VKTFIITLHMPDLSSITVYVSAHGYREAMDITEHDLSMLHEIQLTEIVFTVMPAIMTTIIS